MASISVRKIDEETLARLRVLAARDGISMEEEVRRIIKRAVSAPEKAGDLAVRLFSPAWKGGKREEIQLPPRDIHDPIQFKS